jgi:transcriptional regulator with XRE-family HTH domain
MWQARGAHVANDADDDEDDDQQTPRRMQERAYMGELGQRVRTLREERGLTQHALAQAAGIATDMVSRLENGHYSSPGLRTLLRLALGMGTTVTAMLPDLATPLRGREGEVSPRARLQALLARASTDDVELIAELAAVVVARRER